MAKYIWTGNLDAVASLAGTRFANELSQAIPEVVGQSSGTRLEAALAELLGLLGGAIGEGSGGGQQVSVFDSGIDPFTAQVETTGDASHPPFVHLSNPGGSGKFLKVRKLKVWGTNGQTVKLRRTASPLATGGSITADTPVRLQEISGGSPVGVLEGCTAHGGTIFTRAESQWQFPILTENAGHIGDVLESSDFALWISPGSALEVALDANSATNVVRVHAIWDEVV